MRSSEDSHTFSALVASQQTSPSPFPSGVDLGVLLHAVLVDKATRRMIVFVTSAKRQVMLRSAGNWKGVPNLSFHYCFDCWAHPPLPLPTSHWVMLISIIFFNWPMVVLMFPRLPLHIQVSLLIPPLPPALGSLIRVLLITWQAILTFFLPILISLLLLLSFPVSLLFVPKCCQTSSSQVIFTYHGCTFQDTDEEGDWAWIEWWLPLLLAALTSPFFCIRMWLLFIFSSSMALSARTFKFIQAEIVGSIFRTSLPFAVWLVLIVKAPSCFFTFVVFF